MREFAFALQKAGHLGFSSRDMSGSFPERFRKYCLHVARLPTLTTEPNWQDVCGFVEIRNCLVHADGILDRFGKVNVVKAFVARHGTPRIDKPHLLVDAEMSHKNLDIVTYKKIVNATMGKDPVTDNLALSILQDEVEHEEDLQSEMEDLEELLANIKVG